MNGSTVHHSIIADSKIAEKPKLVGMCRMVKFSVLSLQKIAEKWVTRNSAIARFFCILNIPMPALRYNRQRTHTLRLSSTRVYAPFSPMAYHLSSVLCLSQSI